MNVESLIGKVVTITDYLADSFEIDAEAGMKGKVVNVRRMPDDVVDVDIDMSDYVEENRKFMKPTYYDANGVPCLTFEQKYKKPLLRDSVYLTTSELEENTEKFFILEKKVSPKDVYAKYINGDSLTDEEINAGFDHFFKLAGLLYSSGSEFLLAAKEANRVYTALEGFRQARQK